MNFRPAATMLCGFGPMVTVGTSDDGAFYMLVLGFRYRAWSGIDTAGDPRPVQGQCTDHHWVPWQTPQAQLLSQAAAAAAASLGGGGGGGGGGALGGDSAGGSLVPGLAPGLDALWPLDGNGWPPPLEGSLAHLDAAHDPSNPAATDFLRTPPMRCCVIADCGLIRHRD